VWKLIKDMLFKSDKWATSAWLPLALAALLIVAGLAYTWSDLGDKGKKVSASLIGLLNAAMLTAAVLGIEVQVFN
jgi:heme/copper-type cytochrome/quinol oxidase subunit 3